VVENNNTSDTSECDNIKGNDENYEHVQSLLDNLPESLTHEERKKASDLIRRYANVFSKSATDLGRNKTLPHRIDTGDCPPIKQAMR